MTRKVPQQVSAGRWRWDPKKRAAAVALAETSLGIGEIAASLGIDRSTLTDWRTRPVFAAEVERLQAALLQESMRYAVARRAERLKRLDERWAEIRQITAERAAYHAANDPDVPGAQTGLLVRTWKSIGSGATAYAAAEWSLDAALAKEEREIAKAAAIELGEWTERKELSGSVELRPATVLKFLPQEQRSDGPVVEAEYREVQPKPANPNERPVPIDDEPFTAAPDPEAAAEAARQAAWLRRIEASRLGLPVDEPDPY